MSICWLLLPFLLSGVGLPVQMTTPGGAAPPTPVPTPNSVVTRLTLRVQLRTGDGTPVGGVTVMLRPASLDLGGPPIGTPVQSGLTDASGGITFTALGPWLWRVTFTGTYAKYPLQAVSAQGRPPYGTTAGDGFVARVQAQEEHVALDAEGQPSTPPIEVAAFVLLPRGPEWVPAIDLSLPDEHPQPLSVPAVAEPRNSPPAGTAVLNPPAGGAVAGFDPFRVSLWLLPMLAAGGALWQVWQRRRTGGPETAPDGAAAAPLEGATNDHQM